MKRETPPQESFSGLAKRWLKTQLKFHGDPIKAAHDRREAEEIEYQARERAEYEAGRSLVNAVMPASWREKLQHLEEQSELARRQRDEEQRREHLSRPNARVAFRFAGDISGELRESIPVEVSWPGEGGSWVVVSLEAVDPIPFGEHHFLAMRVAMPVDSARSGTPIDLATAVQRFEADWDPLDAQIWIDSDEASFYWSGEGSSSRFSPSPGLSALEIVFPVRDERGRSMVVEGRILFPEFGA